MIHLADLSVTGEITASLQAKRSAQSRRDLDKTIVRGLPEAFG